MTDTITLTVPYDRPYQGVVRLVVGGLAARLELPLEELDDVQLALEALLSDDSYASGDTVTVEVEVTADGLGITVGPLETKALDAALEAEPDPAKGIGLGRVLRTVMGGYEVEGRDGGGWVRMRKNVPVGGAGVE
jgi:anti-sigma regulatory factor (Ser/Thr protein kinase)